MPLTSTRGSASSSGYGQNLAIRTSKNIFTAYGYGPYQDINFTSVADMKVSPDGTAMYITQLQYNSGTGGYDSEVAAYSRDVSTGKVTFVASQSLGSYSVTASGVFLTISPDSKNLYVTLANNYTSPTDATNIIFQYSINSTTKNIIPLTPSSISVGTGTGITYPTTSADGNFVYIGSGSQSSIYIYSRNSTTGLLTYSNTYTTPYLTLPWYITVSNDNSYLYASSRGSDSANAILQYSRNTVTGNISPLSPEGVSGGTSMRQLNFNPSQGGLHCSNGTNVYIYGRNSGTGQLTASATQGGSLFKVTFSADGSLMLGCSSSTTPQLQTAQAPFQGTIAAGTGVVTPYNNPRFVGIQTAAFLVPSPTYDYYYSVGLGTILQWQVSGGYLELVNCPSPLGGRLNVNGTSTYGNTPSFLVISPDQKTLYANGYYTQGLSGKTKLGSQFNLDPSTKLPTRATSTSTGTNQGCGCIVISSDNAFLYSVDMEESPPVIRQYSRNTTTGNLTPLSSPTITLPTPNSGSSPIKDIFGAPILSNDGKNLYISWYSSIFGTVSIPYIIQYSRDTSTGLLTFMSTINIGTNTISHIAVNLTEGIQLAIHPNDGYVYCSNGFDENYLPIKGTYTFLRNPTTGALSSYSTTVTPATSNWACISPDGKNVYLNSNSRIYIFNISPSTGALSLSKYVALTSYPSTSKIFIAPNGTFLVTYANGKYIAIQRNTSSGDLLKPFSQPFVFSPPINTASQAYYDGANSIAIDSTSTKLYLTASYDGNQSYVGFGTISGF